MQFPKLDKQSLTEGIVIPKMVKVRQSFPSHNLTDPIGRLKEQLQSLDKNTIENLAGKRIGITAGSRGLPHYKELMKVLCDQLKAWKAQPFVFPAMGSHAGATAEGQKGPFSPIRDQRRLPRRARFIDHGCRHRRHPGRRFSHLLRQERL